MGVSASSGAPRLTRCGAWTANPVLPFSSMMTSSLSDFAVSPDAGVSLVWLAGQGGVFEGDSGAVSELAGDDGCGCLADQAAQCGVAGSAQVDTDAAKPNHHGVGAQVPAWSAAGKQPGVL